MFYHGNTGKVFTIIIIARAVCLYGHACFLSGGNKIWGIEGKFWKCDILCNIVLLSFWFQHWQKF